MLLPELLQPYARHPQVSALCKLTAEPSAHTIYMEGLHASAPAVVLAAWSLRMGRQGRTCLVVLEDEERAGYFYHDLTRMLPDDQVLFYPSAYRRAVKYAQRDAANEILRTEVLGRLSARCAAASGAEADSLFVVTYPDAVARRVAPCQAFTDSSITLSEGESHDLTGLTKRLLELGFHRKDYVYEPGEFALRGSILDVFSYASEYPLRIDFFGDEIDSIRLFEVQTQLSRERKKEARIVPDTQAARPQDGQVPFTDYLPADTVVVSADLTFVADAIDRIYSEGFVRQAALASEAQSEMEEAERRAQLERELQLITASTFLRGVAGKQRIAFGPARPDKADAVLHFSASPQPLYHKNFTLLETDLAQFKADGYTLYILADSPKQTERLQHIFEETGKGTSFQPVERTLHEGFVDHTLRQCCLTDHQIFDRFHKYNLKTDHARDAKMALTLKELMQFEPGDFVVHIDYGVGRFAGLVRMPAADGELQEMIKLTYKNDDAVYVSIHSLHKVSKYKGREGEPPRMSTLGTGAWEKLKERTKKKIKDIARDLIRLYSLRKEEKGYAFSADSFMQHELEAGFAYEDTPDQLRVTQEVKADMESSRPMDRLVCGDVGFGKTEIAVRAAMKAAADSKQVAVLVPTTVLALQHYKTFASRLKDFPVRVDYLSRARTAAQTKAVLKDLAEGKIDILVGTHKLIGKNVKWHDLGLLIIDEEQKFGVAVK